MGVWRGVGLLFAVNRRGLLWGALCFFAGRGLAGGAEWFSNQEAGSRGPTVLKLNAGARALGLGGAFVGVADDASALAWNPAGLHQLARQEAQWMRVQLFAGQTQDYVGYARPAWRWKERETWGFSISRYAMDSLEVHDEGENIGTAHPQEFSLAVSYARPWGAVSWGTTAKCVEVETFDQKGRTVAADIGVLRRGEVWSWGAAVAQLGPPLTLGNTSTGLPTVLRAGVVRRHSLGCGILLMSLQEDVGLEDKPLARLGAEYGLPFSPQWRGAVRAGGKTRGQSRFSIGAGLSQGSIGFDYAYSPDDELGSTQRIDMTWRFGKELTPEVRRRELLKTARSLMAAGDWGPALAVVDELRALSPRHGAVRELDQDIRLRFSESLEPDSLLALGRRAFEAGDVQTALEKFRKLLIIHPGHVEGSAWLARVERLEKRERERRLREEVGLARTVEARRWALEAKTAFAREDWETAQRLGLQAIKVGGESPEIRSLLARCLEHLQSEAKRRSALSGEKYHLGMKAYLEGDWEKAEKLFAEATLLNPGDRVAAEALAQVREERRLRGSQHTGDR